MLDPFAVAAAALFRAPGSQAAMFLPRIYDPAVGSEIPIRIICLDAEQMTRQFAGSTIMENANVFQFLAADVIDPKDGDAFTTTDPRTGQEMSFTIYGDPLLDVEGVSWTCSANPA